MSEAANYLDAVVAICIRGRGALIQRDHPEGGVTPCSQIGLVRGDKMDMKFS
jgi:hypothetical protein